MPTAFTRSDIHNSEIDYLSEIGTQRWKIFRQIAERGLCNHATLVNHDFDLSEIKMHIRGDKHLYERIDEEGETISVIYSNGQYLFAVVECDICGEIEATYPDHGLHYLSISDGFGREYDALESFNDFLRLVRRRRGEHDFAPGGIPAANLEAHLKEKFDVELDRDALRKWWMSSGRERSV